MDYLAIWFGCWGGGTMNYWTNSCCARFLIQPAFPGGSLFSKAVSGAISLPLCRGL
jgi:hypothetical protein